MDESEFQRRFGGLQRLYGIQGAQSIFRSHLVVVGLGGVGSWAAEALARSGVGQLTLIDLDHVAESNINRQVHAMGHTLGMAKVQAMRQRIADINPNCKVNCIEEFVEPGNWPDLLFQLHAPVNAVVDACDQVRAKVAIASWARQQSDVCFVSVGAAGGKKMAHRVDLQDLSQVTHDPLLAQVRMRLRKEHAAPREGKKMNIACVFSTEPVAAPHESCGLAGDGSLNCHGYGSVVSVTASFGQVAAGFLLDEIASKVAN
jgi:tRNA A37 threonylcarbamoyladenosine dehydratase